MAKLITGEEFLKSIEEDKVVDMNNPDCFECNDCCGLGTLLYEHEYLKLKQYLRYNPIGNIIHRKAIKKFKEYLERGIIYAVCPFSDTTNKRCKIYKDRPLVCKEFHCKKELNRCNIEKYRAECTRTISEVFFKRGGKT